MNDSKWWSSYAECPLLDIESDTDKIRVITELIQLAGAFLYIVAALREMKFLGYHMFIENLVCANLELFSFSLYQKNESQFNASNFVFQMTAPSRVMFLFSCCLMMTVIPLRIFCLTEIEDHVCVMIMLTTAPYFLFFCR